MKKILKFLFFICLAAITLTACGGDETNSTGTAAAATARVPDTNQTTSYTSTFGEDHDYTINPPSYTDNGNGTIRDNVTGLIWQKQDDATERTWANASTYCDSLVLGGQTDWRLPSRIELISIVDYGVYGPAINTTFFPDTQSSDYWSSITYASFTSYAWNVAFYGGNTNTHYNKTNSYYVRCVRGGETTQSLTDNGNGTVTDSGTLLTWQQGENNVTSVEAALSYCEGLYLAGHADWRLPNVKELSSIVDDTRYNPAINTTFFPDTSSSTYWSSTTYTGSASYAWGVYAWGVDFSYGGTGYFNKEAYFGLPPESKGVRCVRGGQ